MRPSSRKTTIALALSALLLPVAGRGQEARPLDEQFRYRWTLSNFVGTLAGLFLPRQGEGELTFKTQQDGDLRSELVITSKAGRQGEYWRYGSVIDPERLQPVRAWSSYLWRGKSKSRSSEIEEQGVMDVVSGIYSIRRDPPEKTRRMEIWSDDRIYPVVVIPRGVERRVLPGGPLLARHYQIRGVDVPGGKKWKGKLDLWLATDEAATPVEIHISRNLADVRLELAQPLH